MFFAVDHFGGYAIMLHNQLISFTKPLIICLALLECFLCQNRCSIRGNILLHPLLGGNCLFVITHPGCHVMIPDNIQHVFLCPGNHGIRICICLFSDCCSYFCSSGFFCNQFSFCIYRHYAVVGTLPDRCHRSIQHCDLSVLTDI